VDVLGGLFLQLKVVVLLAETVVDGADLVDALGKPALDRLALVVDALVHSSQTKDFGVLVLDAAVYPGKLRLGGDGFAFVLFQNLFVFSKDILALNFALHKSVIDFLDFQLKSSNFYVE
jgi:hypothetical protein